MNRLLPAALAATLLSTGCVSTSDFEQAQHQIADLQEELAQLKRSASSKEEVQSVNQRIADQTEQLLRSNATLVTKVDSIEERVQNIQGSVEQTNYRVDRLAQQATQTQADVETLRAQVNSAPTIVPPATGPGTTVPGPPMSEVTVAPTPIVGENPMDTYQSAYRDYQKGNYDLAIAGFREFIAKNGSSDLADNAAYWIGESLFSQKKYPQAIEQFDNVITKYPKSDKVPGALLKKGYAYISINEKAQGIVQLQYVVHEHPKSQEAALARQKLKQLGIETK